MGTLGAAVKTGFDVKRGVRGSHHRRNNGPRVTFIMTMEGLLSHPIEVEVSSFWFGLSTAPPLNSGPTFPVRSKEFTIQKVSDKWSLFMQQASMTGKAIQVSMTVVEQLTDDRTRRVAYAFSNASIKSIQPSGTAANGVMETVQFNSEETLLHEMVHGVRDRTGLRIRS